MSLQTKKDLVRNHLLQGKYITSLMAFTPAFRTNTRLSASIFMLRDEGMLIKTGTADSAFEDGVITKAERNDILAHSNTTNYAVYYILPSQLEEQRHLFATAV